MLLAALLAVACAADLAVFAGRFYPYIDPVLALQSMTFYLKNELAPAGAK